MEAFYRLIHPQSENSSLASIPIGYSVNMNEEYQSLKLVLKGMLK